MFCVMQTHTLAGEIAVFVEGFSCDVPPVQNSDRIPMALDFL